MNALNMKIKILLIASEPSPGMIPFACKIINILHNDKRFDIRCVCVNSNTLSYRDKIHKDVESVFIDIPHNKVLNIAFKLWPWSVIKAINDIDKKFSPQFIHFLTGDYILANDIALHRDRRFCYTVHDLNPHEISNKGIGAKIIQYLINSGYRRNHKNCINLCTSSYNQKEDLEKLYPNKNISLIPFPSLVTDEISTGSKTPAETEGLDNYILFFGGVKKYKGVDLLIEAFYKSDFSQTHKLVIAGKGNITPPMKDNIIHINRFINDNEIKNLFVNSSLVVYPYISATMSGVLSIAFYFKKKVLLSDVPFFKEYANPCCSFFKAGDVNDLTNKLNILINTSEFSESNYYKEFFSDEVISTSLNAFYTFQKIKKS